MFSSKGYNNNFASAVFAVITVIADGSASKVSMLGYKSHCSFAPISTILLVIIALVLGIIFWKIFGKKYLYKICQM